jgi:hypothetical protein
MPDDAKDRGEQPTKRYLTHLGSVLSLESDKLELLGEVAHARNLSLRTIERIATCLTLAKAFTPPNHLWLDPIMTGLCVMRVLHSNLFRRARAGTLTIDEVRGALGMGNWASDASLNEYVTNWWIYCLAEKEEDHPTLEWGHFRQLLFSYSISRRRIVAAMANHIDRLQLPKSRA